MTISKTAFRTLLFALGCWPLLILSSTFASATEDAAQKLEVKSPAIAFSGRVVGNSDRFRMILDFDRNVERNIYVLSDPKRLIIDLSETVFRLDDKAVKSPSSLVNDIRYGTIAPGKSRIVMELTGPVKVAKSSLRRISGAKTFRLILDVVSATETEFEMASKVSEETRAGGKVPYKGDRVVDPVDRTKVFTLVIDPGHGGIDGGAQGRSNTIEKVVTLQFAKVLRDAMKGNPAFRVLLTREDDTFVSLRDRIDFAHRNGADLMISVHADSLRQRNIRGATVYTLSEEGTDELSRQLAEKQNRADLIAGLDLPKVDDSVTDILIDLTRRETEVFSTRFARMLVDKMKGDVKLIKNPHRSADFFVLKAADIPSVLLELGYLSNSEDEKLMKSPKWQRLAAKKLAEAAEQFFQLRMVAQ